ncbi:MAG TPA: sigma-70 family RNA polymerase sigma factor [Candidatus Saccharimonadales bacterium]|nr:sigma-70 family RNA polymerase sigma factor [Candidatus Saccharimonadales bacterium]
MSEFLPRPDPFSSFAPELAAPMPPPTDFVPADSIPHEAEDTTEINPDDLAADYLPDDEAALSAEQIAEQEWLAELEQGVADGDVDALMALLGHYGPQIKRMISGRLRGASEEYIEDVFQEWHISALTSFHKFTHQPDSSFIGWIVTLAKRRIVDQIRIASRRRERILLVSDTGPAMESQSQNSNLERLGAAALDAYPSETNNEELYALLAQLSPKQRKIFILRIGYGFSAEETAEMVNSTEGGVRVAQHRAVARLRSIIRQNPKKYADLHDRLLGYLE